MAKKRRQQVTRAGQWRKSIAARKQAQEEREERKEWLQSKEGREARQEALFAANRLAEQLGIDTSDGYKKAMGLGEIQTVKVSPEEMKRAARSAVNYHDLMCRTQSLETSTLTKGKNGEEIVSRMPSLGGTRLGQGIAPQFLDVRIGPVVDKTTGTEATNKNTSVEMFIPEIVLAGSPIGENAVSWGDNTRLLNNEHAVGADWYTIPGAEAGQDIYLTIAPPDGKLVANLYEDSGGAIYCSWGSASQQPAVIVGSTGKPNPSLSNIEYTYEEGWDSDKRETAKSAFETAWNQGKITHTILLAAYDEGLGRYVRTPGDPSARLSWNPCLSGSGAGAGMVTCLFPGPLQVEMVGDTLWLVQRWCRAKGDMYEFVELTNGEDADIGGTGCSSKYASRIRLFTHAEDHSEGLIKAWDPTDTTAQE